MCSVKKILGIIFLLACIILPQTVSAEKKDYKDKNFNFRNVRRVVLLNVSSNINFNERGSVFVQRLRNTYYDNSRKLKCQVLTEDEARRMAGSSNFSGIADLCILCDIRDWSDDYYVVPERTSWEEKKMYRTVRDRDGRRHEESYYQTVPVTYPPYRVDVSKIAVNFEVYDTRTGKMVFGREDVRDRNDKTAQDGMYGRICNSFFEDLAKLIQ